MCFCSWLQAMLTCGEEGVVLEGAALALMAGGIAFASCGQ